MNSWFTVVYSELFQISTICAVLKDEGHFPRHLLNLESMTEAPKKSTMSRYFSQEGCYGRKYILCFIVSRGIFNQGYLCLKCGLGAHKECLGRLGVCGRTGEMPPPHTHIHTHWFSFDFFQNFGPSQVILKSTLLSMIITRHTFDCTSTFYFGNLYSSATTRVILSLINTKYQNLKGRSPWNLLSTFMLPRGAPIYILSTPWIFVLYQPHAWLPTLHTRFKMLNSFHAVELVVNIYGPPKINLFACGAPLTLLILLP